MDRHVLCGFDGWRTQTKPEGLSSSTNVKPGTGQDFVVNVGDRVYFDEDQSILNAQGQAAVNGQAKWLARYSQYTITIEGHAVALDNITSPLERAVRKLRVTSCFTRGKCNALEQFHMAKKDLLLCV